MAWCALMGLFSRKPTVCAVCGKEARHSHKPKREWGVSGRLCGDCHVEKTKAHYDSMTQQACAVCGTVKRMHDLWEPHWKWDMDGLLCKSCFDSHGEEHEKKRNNCSRCGGKMGIIRYNPKPKWKITGQLCRNCWDTQKAELG